MPSKRVKNVHWIKWQTKETVYGSFMTEPVESLGFMVKLCCLSAETRYPGYVQSEYQKGIPHIQLASLLNIPIDKFEELLALHKAGERITENGDGVITIVNWGKYQVIPAFSGSPEDIALRGIEDAEEADDAKAGAELEAGGVTLLEKKYGHRANPRKVRAHDQFTSPEEYRKKAGWGDEKSPRPLPKNYTKPEEL